jgi:hypothetical protein
MNKNLPLFVDSKALLWIMMASSLLIGWSAETIIYKHIFKTGIKEQPINVLIFIEQVS